MRVKTLETAIQSCAGFNKSSKGRRSWQRSDGPYKRTFTLSASIFVRPYNYNLSQLLHPPYKLHPWIAEAVAPDEKGQQPEYYPNPHRPEVFDCVTGTLKKIGDTEISPLKTGDIVWISFSVEFVITKDHWYPSFVPKDIIRVSAVPEVVLLLIQGGRSNFAAEDETEYRRLEVGTTFMISMFLLILCLIHDV